MILSLPWETDKIISVYDEEVEIEPENSYKITSRFFFYSNFTVAMIIFPLQYNSLWTLSFGAENTVFPSLGTFSSWLLGF